MHVPEFTAHACSTTQCSAFVEMFLCNSFDNDCKLKNWRKHPCLFENLVEKPCETRNHKMKHKHLYSKYCSEHSVTGRFHGFTLWSLKCFFHVFSIGHRTQRLHQISAVAPTHSRKIIFEIFVCVRCWIPCKTLFQIQVELVNTWKLELEKIHDANKWYNSRQQGRG